MAFLSILRVLPSKQKAFAIAARQTFDPLKVFVITCLFASQQGVQRMMKVIIPHRVAPYTPQLKRANEASIVSIALRDQMHPAAQLLSGFVDGSRKLL